MVNLGRHHSGAITKDGSLYMWGNNFFGQLGDGTTINRTTPTKIMDNILSTASRQSIQKQSLSTPKVTSETANFSSLQPNQSYSFYAVKDKNSDNVLLPENLGYLKGAE